MQARDCCSGRLQQRRERKQIARNGLVVADPADDKRALLDFAATAVSAGLPSSPWRRNVTEQAAARTGRRPPSLAAETLPVLMVMKTLMWRRVGRTANVVAKISRMYYCYDMAPGDSFRGAQIPVDNGVDLCIVPDRRQQIYGPRNDRKAPFRRRRKNCRQQNQQQHQRGLSSNIQRAPDRRNKEECARRGVDKVILVRTLREGSLEVEFVHLICSMWLGSFKDHNSTSANGYSVMRSPRCSPQFVWDASPAQQRILSLVHNIRII